MDYRNLPEKKKKELLKQVIKNFKMKPLVFEGGFFTETYRSGELFFCEGYKKSLTTSILFLITANSWSRLHRLPSTEIYHFYFGDPVAMLNIDESGAAKKIILGNDIFSGEIIQHTVPPGCWQGSFLVNGGVFALMGTTMSPGFEPGDYENGILKRDLFIKKFPRFKEMILKLTRE